MWKELNLTKHPLCELFVAIYLDLVLKPLVLGTSAIYTRTPVILRDFRSKPYCKQRPRRLFSTEARNSYFG